MNFSFDVEIYGKFEKINSVLSKARVRIFYSGLNRNLTYITEEFGEKLLSTLPYTPVVGKYNGEDFTNHGNPGDQLQVYGVVPENPNINWEKHLDKDNVERNYACADVILWTARFPEANAIAGKSQSMELYPKSVNGQWVYQDGKKFFKFTDACFLGLTALGDRTEPCFEGAAFYSYADSLQELVDELKEYNLNNKEGGNKMAFDFKLSDDQKRNAIFRLVNPRLESEGYIDYSVCEIYDDYALCFSYADGNYERFYYTKDDKEDSVVITNNERAYVLDVTQSEYEALQRMQAAAGTYAELESKYNDSIALNEQNATTIQEYANKQTEDANKISDLSTQNTEYSAKIEGLNSQITDLNNQVTDYSTQIQNLNEYKDSVELKQKEDLISKFSTIIPEEILANFKAKMGEYSVEDFKRELSVSAIENNEQTIFSQKTVEIVPTNPLQEELNCSGAQRLINKYTHKSNGGNE